MVRSLDHILFLPVYNTKGRILSARLVWLLVMRFGGMPLEQMEVFSLQWSPSGCLNWASVKCDTKLPWSQSKLLKEGEMNSFETGQGRYFCVKEKKPSYTVNQTFHICHKAHQELGLFVSMWWPVTQGTSPQRWPCWEVRGMSHDWAEADGHSWRWHFVLREAQAELLPLCTDGDLTHRWQYPKKPQIITHKKCMV